MSLGSVVRMSNGFEGVIVASANSALRKQIAGQLIDCRVAVEEATGGADAIDKLEMSECRLLLLDRELPDLNAEEVAGIVREQYPGVDVLMLDPHTGVPARPARLNTTAAEDLLRLLQAEEEIPKKPVQRCDAGAPARRVMEPLPGMVSCSAAMQRVYQLVRLVAPRSTAVLITGESGTGKELVAQAIHALSARSQRSWVALNCAAIPEALLESELFGVVRGAYTGAVQSRVGRIHSAQGGTLFLDEVGEMPLNLQSKMLRFLELGEVQRLGSTDTFRVDVRVVAATNAQLEEKVRRGEFRADLYYRLMVFPIELPPLRRRADDILPLAHHFLNQMNAYGATLSVGAERLLESHTWPGNVRELRHVMERASILADGAQEIGSEHIMLTGETAILQ